MKAAMATRISRFTWRRQARTERPCFGRTQQYGFPIFKPRGDLDYACCADFLKALQADVDGRHRTIAIDLNRVTSIDLSVAWLLRTVDQHMQAGRRRLLLLDAGPGVQQTLLTAWERIPDTRLALQAINCPTPKHSVARQRAPLAQMRILGQFTAQPGERPAASGGLAGNNP